MKKSLSTFLITFLPMFFGIFGIGHFYLNRKKEGIMFFILGIVNVLGIFFYMPFEAESLLSQNISAYYGSVTGVDMIAPIITMGVCFSLFASSIFRIGTFVSDSK